MKLKNKLLVTKRIWLKTLLSIIIFTVIYFLLFILLYRIVSNNIWKETDIIYIILKFIQNFILPIWFVGIIIIFIYFYSNAKIYFNKIEEEKKRKELIVYLAHDLKNPLTSIIGYLDLILSNKNITEDKKQNYLDIVMEKSLSLEELINELFEITKLDSPDLKLNLEKVDIQLLLDQIIDGFYPELIKLNKKIEFINLKKSIYINADIDKIFRAFNNLIKNAINYSKINTDVLINITENKGIVTINISNKCDNIKQKDINRLFDKFYRADKSRNSKTGGSGLGLPIAKEIIELHKGTINAYINGDSISFVIKIPKLRKN